MRTTMSLHVLVTGASGFIASHLVQHLARLASWFQPQGVGQYLRTHLGRVPRFDHGKIERELGLAFRPVERSILDTVADLARWGHVPAPA